MLRKECVSGELINLLKKLQSYEELEKYFLVGGTSLALQLGHRTSEDIDLFTIENINKGDLRFIVPCYKQAGFLDECLNSVVEQTFKDWECIIVDDGSPDNTEEIAKKWVGNDTRIKY